MTGIKGLVSVVVATALIGCGTLVGNGSAGPPSSNPVQQSHGGPVRDHVSFVDALRARGVAVEILGEVEQAFLTPKGVRLGLSGGPLSQSAEVQSFDYETDVQARDDAAQITPEGQSRTTMVTWIDDPHFYRKDRLIVLYVGKDPAVLQLLVSLLGPQFAGR